MGWSQKQCSLKTCTDPEDSTSNKFKSSALLLLPSHERWHDIVPCTVIAPPYLTHNSLRETVFHRLQLEVESPSNSYVTINLAISFVQLLLEQKGTTQHSFLAHAHYSARPGRASGMHCILLPPVLLLANRTSISWSRKGGISAIIIAVLLFQQYCQCH